MTYCIALPNGAHIAGHGSRTLRVLAVKVAVGVAAVVACMAASAQDNPQLQQRRQELRSTVRQQHAIVQAPASQNTQSNSQDSAASAPTPRHLSADERTELRRQLTRDLRAQRSTGSAQQP
jgi:hypothetical protein